MTVMKSNQQTLTTNKSKNTTKIKTDGKIIKKKLLNSKNVKGEIKSPIKP